MSDVLKDLARQIAATGKWQPRPGMAVRDPKHGSQWRNIGRGGWAHDSGWLDDGDPEVPRALAAGPDLTDEVTALGLLADLPSHRLRNNDNGGDRWVCWPLPYTNEVSMPSCGTRAEAIARAWLAAHGGDND